MNNRPKQVICSVHSSLYCILMFQCNTYNKNKKQNLRWGWQWWVLFLFLHPIFVAFAELHKSHMWLERSGFCVLNTVLLLFLTGSV